MNPTGKEIVERLAQGVLKDDVRGHVRQIVKPGGLARMTDDFAEAIRGATSVCDVDTPCGVVRTATHADGTTVSARVFSSGGLPSLQVNDPNFEQVVKVRYEN